MASNSLCNRVLPLCSRRAMLKSLSCGFGWLAFSALAHRTMANRTMAMDKAVGTHFAASAKRVIFLCMRGGPSHVDTLDYKPKLIADSGKTRPATRQPNYSDRPGSSSNMAKADCGSRSLAQSGEAG